ncbi:radical SAM protein [Candidatus Micrarchaeota archaeon]|nr:radical SAM protein [Candidatus Micrarchaeota archaeon]MBU1165990.1 radical SAM protein [Candidatus Micrarchaeota archaeon]MBU1886433.1 radical SAM protein [Candidatus Micrarchaeota archaeon]
MEKIEKAKLSDFDYSILQIETQGVCNMKCEFCPYVLRKNKSAKLSDEEVYKLIDSIEPEEKMEYMCFSHFNEPLMDKRIFDFIAHAKKSGHRTLLITNSLLFKSQEIIDKLIKAEPTYIKISLQTINENTYKARGANHLFDDYRKNVYKFIKAALDGNCKSEITMDVACNFLTGKKRLLKKMAGLEYGDPSMPISIDDIKPDIIEFIRKLSDFEPRIKFDAQEITKILSNASPDYLDQTGIMIVDNISIKIKKFFFGRRLSKFHPVKNSIPCQTRILGILADGNVVPCCLDYDGALALGNIKNESICSILDRNRKFLSAIKTGSGSLPETCRRCQGAPTKIGTHVLEIARHVRKLRKK